MVGVEEFGLIGSEAAGLNERIDPDGIEGREIARQLSDKTSATLQFDRGADVEFREERDELW